MKLFEINGKLRELWSKIEEQEGELLEEDIKAMEELELAKDEKLKGYGVIIRELDGDIAECKAELDRIKGISDRLKNRREWLVGILKGFMLENSIPKYESVEVTIGFRKSKSLEGAEQALIDGTLPKEFIVQTITEKPDKTAITNFIKGGGTVEGCQLVEKENISIK